MSIPQTLKHRAIVTALLVVVIGAGAAYFLSGEKNSPAPPVITSFKDCANYYAIIESHPRQCKAPDGRTFAENAGNELEKQNLIRVTAPRPNERVASPLAITGEARGNWYFEASFPVELLGAIGEQIALTPAHAKGEWMTTNFVPFDVTLTFPPQPAGSKGTLILRKDNPSGLPKNDDALIVPIVF